MKSKPLTKKKKSTTLLFSRLAIADADEWAGDGSRGGRKSEWGNGDGGGGGKVKILNFKIQLRNDYMKWTEN